VRNYMIRRVSHSVFIILGLMGLLFFAINVLGDPVELLLDEEASQEVIEASLPAVVAAEKGLNSPRYPSLPGIMKAKRKKIAVKTPDDLGVPASEMGAAAALVQITKWSPPPVRAAPARMSASGVIRPRTGRAARA